MNSFSFDLKNEVAELGFSSDDEALSFLSAIIKTSGEIVRNGTHEHIIIFTELESVAGLINDVIKNLYGKDIQQNVLNNTFSKNDRFELTLPEEITNDVLRDTEIAQFDEEKYMYYEQGINNYMIASEERELAFFRGVFVGSFSCNINLSDENAIQKHSSGYHAEFVFSNKTFAQDFCFLLADFDIISKMTERKNQFVVYVKGAEMICDMLTILGATNGTLKLQNESVLREVRNNINRQNNCYSANLTKTVDASISQMRAIDKIRNTIGIDSLDESLKEVIYLRLANPEESLDSLVKLSAKPISKSGLYHRFKKIEKIAEKLWYINVLKCKIIIFNFIDNYKIL